MIHVWKQRIGTNRRQPRLTLWNRKLIAAGFGFGQPVALTVGKTSLTVIPDANGKRRVLRVMNHGNELPVLEFLGKWIGHVGQPGDTVQITVEPGQITIDRAPR